MTQAEVVKVTQYAEMSLKADVIKLAGMKSPLPALAQRRGS